MMGLIINSRLALAVLVCCISLVISEKTINEEDRQDTNGCNGTVTLTASEGFITSPNFPNNYGNSMLCRWLIRAQSGYQIDISFTNFTLEAHSSCSFDSVEIFDGSSDAAPSLGLFCGSDLPPDVQSTNNEAFVRFRSDSSVTFSGFRLFYRMRRVVLHPVDCAEIRSSGQSTSGVYQVWPRSRAVNGPINVYCDMVTAGGGWTVIQRRGNFNRPTNYFYQDWEAYKTGFGNLEQDFWLGNDNIFALTNQKAVSVRFDLLDVNGTYAYAEYSRFFIDGEEHQYELHIRGYSGTADDSMIQTHDHQKFTTKDLDNDNFQHGNCAVAFKGAWWYNACHTSNLNGLYHRGRHESFADGINWLTFRGYFESLEATEIKIR